MNLPKELLESVKDGARLVVDSRDLREGDVFFAIRGTRVDGHQYIKLALDGGVSFVVGEEPSSSNRYFQVESSRKAWAECAALQNAYPAKGLRVIGITGTSGKTTTTYLLESIFQAAGQKTGVIGTNGIRIGDQNIATEFTTPDPPELQSVLAQMSSQGVETVLMEVSSHGLDQYRVWGVTFDVCGFSNLSAEHLDYHHDMEEYFRAKAKFFGPYYEESTKQGKSPVAVVNATHTWGKRLISELTQKKVGSKTLDDFGTLESSLSGITGNYKGVQVNSGLVGAFNIENIAMAIEMALAGGATAEAIASGIKNLASVPGRLERVSNEGEPVVLVDYAHKPDALEKVLRTLKNSKEGRLISVFGCGGDRDKTKRPEMGRIATDLSDAVFVTSDNPRTEDPAKIIDEILAGVNDTSITQRVDDREEAIKKAIEEAKPTDVVLIAGKGHEDYQIIRDPKSRSGTRKIHFDDREIARRALDGKS